MGIIYHRTTFSNRSRDFWRTTILDFWGRKTPNLM